MVVQLDMYNSDNLEISIRNLKRGLMTGDEHVALTAYQSLFDSGQAASPHLLRELKKFVVTTQYRREANNLFAGLLSLHREIDELGSDAFITEAIATKPTDVFAALLNSARRMKSRDYKQARILGTAIWEHSDIDPRYGASSHICQWLSELPTDDVNGLEAHQYRSAKTVRRLGRPIYACAGVDCDWLGDARTARGPTKSAHEPLPPPYAFPRGGPPRSSALVWPRPSTRGGSECVCRTACTPNNVALDATDIARAQILIETPTFM